ncbi:Protein flp [Psilocybe cubensis]|uniref:Beta-lactamase-related domain-containing protein n=2 Tax=Psilocybe cubensis TaxID=181762 RepID=A0A8H7Y3Y8_PSICU|nr:Protein flp [Psilocybe cubensis]KAH9484585.1 Protein flp [Psilocybe cubensis]
MRLQTWTFTLILGIKHSSALQVPFFTQPESNGPPKLISSDTDQYVESLISKWNSSGLSVAVVQRDETSTTGWNFDFGGYGMAKADGSPVTPDSLFAIASNSKLFLAFSVGLLISNKTLTEERGQELKWSTKIRDLIPEWGLMDDDMDRGVSLQDMLSHRTGMPRHDLSGVQRNGGVAEMISTLRYLRPSAEFRETFQYNNLMYETLSYLPQVLLNQTYESYISQHLFNPLNMTSSTYSVEEAEAWGTLADGFQWDMQDTIRGINGTRIATVPYFQRPGEEKTWAGAGGVLTSARDLAIWVAMLLNGGRHPFTNETVIPQEVVEHVAHGRSVSHGKPQYPELSPKVYGAGQWRYSYRGHDIIEHGGSNPGYKTQVARFPDNNFAIITLSNDERGGNAISESVKFRIANELLGLPHLEKDWNDRLEDKYNEAVNKSQQVTPRPSPPVLPNLPFTSLAEKTFHHPTYGSLKPCLAPQTVSSIAGQTEPHRPHSHCGDFLQSTAVQRILGASDLSIPTYVIPWKRSFSTHLRLAHFTGNIFNLTNLWSNADVREREGYKSGADLLTGFEEAFEVEWVTGDDEGLAFRGGFWGREGPDSRSPEGSGKASAEVWFEAQ